MKPIMVIAVIAMLGLACLARYELVPVTSSSAGYVLRLDRWTGRITFVTPGGESSIPEEKR